MVDHVRVWLFNLYNLYLVNHVKIDLYDPTCLLVVKQYCLRGNENVRSNLMKAVMINEVYNNNWIKWKRGSHHSHTSTCYWLNLIILVSRSPSKHNFSLIKLCMLFTWRIPWSSNYTQGTQIWCQQIQLPLPGGTTGPLYEISLSKSYFHNISIDKRNPFGPLILLGKSYYRTWHAISFLKPCKKITMVYVKYSIPNKQEQTI